VTQSSEATVMQAWVTAVAQELGLADEAGSGSLVDTVLDLTSGVAHPVSRPAAPVTAFLVGLAAGRQAAPAVAAPGYAQKISALAEGWDAEGERGVPSNDQESRA